MTSDDDRAWRERLAKLIDRDATTIAKAARRQRREWLPISADPINGRSRRRAVQHAVAQHAAGGCPTCGKPSPLDSDDCCRCGSAPENWGAAVARTRHRLSEARKTSG